MSHKNMKQIKEEMKSVNFDFKNDIKEINEKSKKQRENTQIKLAQKKQKYQDDWDKMDKKQVKRYNLFMRTVGILCLVVGLMCVFVDPLAIGLIIAGIFFVRFDANKRKSNYKELKKQEKEEKNKK